MESKVVAEKTVTTGAQESVTKTRLSVQVIEEHVNKPVKSSLRVQRLK